MTTTTPEVDPLEAHESLPAVSFHAPNGGYAMGQVAKLAIREYPELIQQRDDDGQPEFWPLPDDAKPGQEREPKLVLVVPVTDEEGVDKNLWAKKMGKKWPDSIFQQLIRAQKKLREETGDPTRRLRPGDTLLVKYAADDTSKPKVKGNYPKKYLAKIEPGQLPAAPPADALSDSGAGEEDPWSTPQADAAAAQPAAETTPRQVGADPFGPADPADADEPPF